MAQKTRILFVDDEPNLLSGLRRMLRGKRKEWDMSFAAGSAEALLMMDEKPFDVIVSDMRMPAMDGAQLLSAVMAHSPQTVRIVLSGQAERNVILRNAAAIQQYLGKPCDDTTLKETVQRACELSSLVPNANLRNVISQLNPFDSLTISCDEFAERVAKAETPVGGLIDIISGHMGMDERIIRQIDGVFLGLRSHIPRPAQAVLSLGLNTLKLLGLSAKVVSQFGANAVLADTALQSLWKRSFTVAEISKRVAEMANAPSSVVDYAFTAGFLHDIGKLIFTGYFAEQYTRVRMKAAQSKMGLLAAECETFGTTHAEVGAFVLGLWGLPQAVVDAVHFHHAPQLGNNEFSAVTAVHIANALEYQTQSIVDTDGSESLNRNYLAQLGLLEQLPIWKEAVMEKVY